MRVIISGLASSGKSTVAKHLSKKFGLKHISAGDKMRAMALKKGYAQSGKGFAEFIKKITPAMDKELDNELIKEIDKDNCVIDSRLMAYIYKGEAYRILLKIPLRTAIERYAKREAVNLKTAEQLINNRNNEDIKRYKKLYKIDISDLSIYDLILDTSYFSIKDMNNIIEHIIRKLLKKN